MIGSYTGRIAPPGKAEDDFDLLHLEALHERLRSGELHRWYLSSRRFCGGRGRQLGAPSRCACAGKRNDLPFGEVAGAATQRRRALGDKYEAVGRGHHGQCCRAGAGANTVPGIDASATPRGERGEHRCMNRTAELRPVAICFGGKFQKPRLGSQARVRAARLRLGDGAALGPDDEPGVLGQHPGRSNGGRAASTRSRRRSSSLGSTSTSRRPVVRVEHDLVAVLRPARSGRRRRPRARRGRRRSPAFRPRSARR